MYNIEDLWMETSWENLHIFWPQALSERFSNPVWHHKDWHCTLRCFVYKHFIENWVEKIFNTNHWIFATNRGGTETRARIYIIDTECSCNSRQANACILVKLMMWIMKLIAKVSANRFMWHWNNYRKQENHLFYLCFLCAFAVAFVLSFLQ